MTASTFESPLLKEYLARQESPAEFDKFQTIFRHNTGEPATIIDKSKSEFDGEITYRVLYDNPPHLSAVNYSEFEMGDFWSRIPLAKGR